MAKKKSGDDGGDRPGNGNIYALLVGINSYQNVTDLSGCLTDLDRIESFLKAFWAIPSGQPFDTSEINLTDGTSVSNRSFGIPVEGYDVLHICRLENEQATYQHILDGFHNFLDQVGASDSVWFHFSGHGSEAPTAEVFKALEVGKDQGLMCHDYQLNNGSYSGFLADKEIAILLDELTSKEGGAPHILVTLDCCHSGGGTRGDIAIRNVEVKTNQARALDSYYLGNFTEAIAAGDLDLSAPPHVVMTACTNRQLAGEKDGGLFTTALIKALESVPGPGLISYADLLIRTRAAVQSTEQHTQTPQFEVLGGQKAYTLFLQGFPFGDPDRYEIGFKNGSYFIGVGAIHGMPTSAEMQRITTARKRPITLDIFSYQNGGTTPTQPDPLPVRCGVDGDVSEDGNKVVNTDSSTPTTVGGLLQSPSHQQSTMEFRRSKFAVRVHVIDFERADSQQEIEGALVRKIGDQHSVIEFRRADLGIKIEVLDTVQQDRTQPVIPLPAAGGNGEKGNPAPSSGQPESQPAITPKQRIGQAKINEVGPQFSTIELLTQDFTFEGDAYYGVLNYLPADPEFVLVDGPEAEVEQFLQAANDFTRIGAKNVQFLTQPEPLINLDLKVSIESERITIRDLRTGQLVDRSYEKHNLEEVFIDLIQIANWRRMLALDNPDPNSMLKDQISLAVEIGNSVQPAVSILEGEANEFIAKKEGPLVRPKGLPDERYYRFTPKVTLQEEQEEELFFYLFSLYSDYSIYAEDERRQAAGTIPYPRHYDWGLDQRQDRDTMYFKLIVTSEEIDYHQFLQEGIFSDRGKPSPQVEITNGFKDWAAITMKVEMVREEAVEATPT